jgi:hypothetical protein
MRALGTRHLRRRPIGGPWRCPNTFFPSCLRCPHGSRRKSIWDIQHSHGDVEPFFSACMKQASGARAKHAATQRGPRKRFFAACGSEGRPAMDNPTTNWSGCCQPTQPQPTAAPRGTYLAKSKLNNMEVQFLDLTILQSVFGRSAGTIRVGWGARHAELTTAKFLTNLDTTALGQWDSASRITGSGHPQPNALHGQHRTAFGG